MFLIHNERTKPMANWFNALAAALVTAGVFAPLAAFFYGVSQMPQDRLRLVLATITCLPAVRFYILWDEPF
jgi:hypothetical protein